MARRCTNSVIVTYFIAYYLKLKFSGGFISSSLYLSICPKQLTTWRPFDQNPKRSFRLTLIHMCQPRCRAYFFFKKIFVNSDDEVLDPQKGFYCQYRPYRPYSVIKSGMVRGTMTPLLILLAQPLASPFWSLAWLDDSYAPLFGANIHNTSASRRHPSKNPGDGFVSRKGLFLWISKVISRALRISKSLKSVSAIFTLLSNHKLNLFFRDKV